jgi:CDP-paratose 2-epimerase
MDRILITGSGGLVGGEAVRYFSPIAQTIIGIDNNSRGRWFGDQGSVSGVLGQNTRIYNYKHFTTDIRDFAKINEMIEAYEPTAIIHCAGQPSHEKSAEIPFEDFQINTVGTVNLLEAVRKYVPKSPFIFVSTNKVYGDGPNYLPMRESENRFDFQAVAMGVGEYMRIDERIHSPFGANKAAADLIVQEYGKYYGMNTVCFRCGCITGPNHQGVEAHGFLSYLCKTAKAGLPYMIYGHQGKQVRDNIHVYDLIDAFHYYLKDPDPGEVYNMGGGFENSCSIREAILAIEKRINKPVHFKYGEARKGDHICYYTDYTKFKIRYPNWQITHSLDEIYEELIA